MLIKKLVIKVIRSLPKRFDIKVTAIEELQDIMNMKVQELIGSLQTFEMAISDKSENKNKGNAFVSNTSTNQEEGDLETDEEISKVIAMVGKHFNNILKRMDRGRRPNVKKVQSDIRKNNDSLKKTKIEEQPNQERGIMCYGCDGYGHLKSECPTHLIRLQKGYYVSWSDEEEESNEESTNHVAFLTGRCEYDEDPYGDAITYHEMFDSYEKICLKREKQKKIIFRLENENQKLRSIVSELQNDVRFLTSQLQNLDTPVSMPTNCSNGHETCLVEKQSNTYARV